MTFRLAFAFALALCSFAVGGAAAASRSASPGPPSARFRPAAGWIVAKPTRSEQPYTFASMVIAVTADDIALLHPFAPFVGLKRLRPRGIIIWATTIGRVATSPFPPFPRGSWPLRLSAFPARSRLGGSTRSEHPATPASGLHPRLEPRGAPLLCNPAPRQEAARRGTSSTRSATPAFTLARAARVLRFGAVSARPHARSAPGHATHRRLDTFEVMTTGTRRAVARV
jgi:hypothetical protein